MPGLVFFNSLIDFFNDQPIFVLFVLYLLIYYKDLKPIKVILSNHITDTNKKIDKLETEFKGFQNKLESVQNKLETEIKSVQNELKTVQKEIKAEIKSVQNELKTEIKAGQNKIDELINILLKNKK